MQNQKSFRRHCRSFLGCSSDNVRSIFVHNPGQISDDGLMLLHSTLIIQEARPKFFNTSLIVLATGPGNPPAVWVWTAETGRLGSKPGQKPDPLTCGRPNPDLYLSTRGFRQVWLDPSGSISSSVFQGSHLWSHSDMLRLIVKY